LRPVQKPIKILYLIPQLTVGGAEKLLCQLVTHLDRDRFSPTVWNMGSPGKFSVPIREAGIPLIEQKPLGRKKYLYLDTIKVPAFIYRERFHIVHSYIFGPHWVDAVLAKAVPGVHYLVARLEVQLWRDGNSRPGLGERLRNRLVSHAVANARAVKDVVVGVEGIEESRVSVIYNGIDPAEFAPYQRRAGAARVAGRFCIGNLATLKSIKSQLTILQALDILVNQRGLQDLEVVFTGRDDGGYESVLQEYATERGLTPYIRSLGEIENVFEVLRDFDVMVLSSLAEGFSVAIVESLAAGVPVVATEVGGNPEIVLPGQTGDLFAVGDYARLADILYDLYADRERLRQLGDRGRDLVHEQFLLPTMVEKHEALYQSLLA
jgi:glycosyltransferase involved in cell wall biosynthesis